VTFFHIIRMHVVMTLAFSWWKWWHECAVSNLQLKGTKRHVQILPTTGQFLKPMLRYHLSALTIVYMCRFFQHFVIILCVLLVFGFGYWLVCNVCTRAEKRHTELWYYRTKLPINSIFLSFLINYSIVFREFMCECLHWISKCACTFWG
jgi:hypothetical protein